MNAYDEQAYQEQMEALYGPSAKFSEYKAGQHVRYRADGMVKTGEITWVSGPGHTALGTPHPTQYWIDGLTCIYQGDILGVVDEGDEPTLERCPHCGQMHQAGQIDSCPMNPNRNH